MKVEKKRNTKNILCWILFFSPSQC